MAATAKALPAFEDFAWPEPELVELPFSLIVRDEALQCRSKKIDSETVADFGERMLRGEKFHPVDVFLDQAGVHLLAHGFHRMGGHEIAGHQTIPVYLRRGERSLALLFSAGANRGQNALRWTNKDASEAAEALLRDPAYQNWTDARIAEWTGSTHPTVGKIRFRLAEALKDEDPEGAERLTSPVRLGRDDREVRIPTLEERLGERAPELHEVRSRLIQLKIARLENLDDGDGRSWKVSALLSRDLERITVATLDHLLVALHRAEEALRALAAPDEVRQALARRIELLSGRVLRINWIGANDDRAGDPVAEVLGYVYTIVAHELPELESAVAALERRLSLELDDDQDDAAEDPDDGDQSEDLEDEDPQDDLDEDDDQDGDLVELHDPGDEEEDEAQEPVTRAPRPPAERRPRAPGPATPATPKPAPSPPLTKSGPVKLPLAASVEELALALRRVQVRCRSGLADADVVAAEVRAQLDRVTRMAEAIGLPLEALGVHGYFYTPGPHVSERTHAHVQVNGIVVQRGHLSYYGPTNGRLTLLLDLPGGG